MVSPYAKDRINYVLNLIAAKKTDRILNVGISNIPEIEMVLEKKCKECVSIDLDKNKLEKASKFLNKTKLIHSNLIEYSFKDNYFDKVIILEVLEHLEDDRLA